MRQFVCVNVHMYTEWYKNLNKSFRCLYIPSHCFSQALSFLVVNNSIIYYQFYYRHCIVLLHDAFLLRMFDVRRVKLEAKNGKVFLYIFFILFLRMKLNWMIEDLFVYRQITSQRIFFMYFVHKHNRIYLLHLQNFKLKIKKILSEQSSRNRWLMLIFFQIRSPTRNIYNKWL
jgi:hypothetical protein